MKQMRTNTSVCYAEISKADEVQEWLRFATTEFEYKIGATIGAVLSDIWSRKSDPNTIIPNLQTWKTVTGLPWAALWLRELLAWGSLEPIAAFLIASKKQDSRETAVAAQRTTFSSPSARGTLLDAYVLNAR